MFSCFDLPLSPGLNLNGGGDLARSKRLFADLLRLVRRTCDPCFVCERGSYAPPPDKGVLPFHANSEKSERFQHNSEKSRCSSSTLIRLFHGRSCDNILIEASKSWLILERITEVASTAQLVRIVVIFPVVKR